MWDASCVLRNYEVRTKQVITPEQLQDGSLAELLVDSDYNLEQSVSASPLLPTFSPPAVRKEEFRCVFTESSPFAANLLSGTDFPCEPGV